MKKEKCWRSMCSYLCVVALALFAFSLQGCKDDESEEVAFDPNKPIVITDFTPKKAGVGGNLIIYGDNFGNDPARLKVIVGGKEANIISVKNQAIYCVVPRMAVDGYVEVSVCDSEGEEIAYVEAESQFEYEKQWLVSRLAGQRFENEKDVYEQDGSFDNCGAIKGATWFSFDPKSDFDHLYMAAADVGSCRLIDLKEETVTMLPALGNTSERPVIINWTADEKQDMIVSRDLKTPGAVHKVLSRASGFTESMLIENVDYRQKGVTGAFVHPKTGILYYCLYESQPMWKYDFEQKSFETFASHMRAKETLRMVVHPEGKYAYMMRLYSGTGNSYIARMDYNDGKFSEPYIIVGHASQTGYQDGVGGNARVNGPGQGVFVKNPEYAGSDDEYDFYFTDEYNHCVRVLTPTGRVTTFAGRGNGSGEPGYADGAIRAEARFSYPWAIAYDEKRKCFYVGERGSHDGKNTQAVIRKIAQEE